MLWLDCPDAQARLTNVISNKISCTGVRRNNNKSSSLNIIEPRHAIPDNVAF